MKKRIHIIFLSVLFIIVITNLTGCDMFLNRKAIAEEALKNQYGEEFVAYHTWDHGGDSFDVSLYPNADESIKFNAVVKNDGRIVVDYYAEKIVGKEIIEVIKPYIDEIAEESAYFATVPRGYIVYTSKDDVSLQNFYSEGNERDTWPYIDICLNKATFLSNISYEDEYLIFMNIFKDERLINLDDKKLVVYFVNQSLFYEYIEYYNNITEITNKIESIGGEKNKITIKSLDDVINLTLEEYIEKRKEIDENER